MFACVFTSLRFYFHSKTRWVCLVAKTLVVGFTLQFLTAGWELCMNYFVQMLTLVMRQIWYILVSAVRIQQFLQVTAHLANTLLCNPELMNHHPGQLTAHCHCTSGTFRKTFIKTKNVIFRLIWTMGSQQGLLRSHTVRPLGITVSRTFVTPSFTVGIWAAVVFSWELLHTRRHCQCLHI